MNVKRYLKKQAEEERQRILAADDGEFLRSLQEMVQPAPASAPAPEKRRRAPVKLKYWLPATASAVAAAVVVTCVIIYYPFGSDHVEYLDANIISENSTLEVLNKDMKQFDLVVDETLYSCAVTKMSDSVSGDVLYYFTRISSLDTFVHIELVTVCNPYYKYKDFMFASDTTDEALSNYTVTYGTLTSTDPEFGIDTLQVTAKIQKGKEFVYVTDYSELLLSPDGSFLEILQSIVK